MQIATSLPESLLTPIHAGSMTDQLYCISQPSLQLGQTMWPCSHQYIMKGLCQLGPGHEGFYCTKDHKLQEMQRKNLEGKQIPEWPYGAQPLWSLCHWSLALLTVLYENLPLLEGHLSFIICYDDKRVVPDRSYTDLGIFNTAKFTHFKCTI